MKKIDRIVVWYLCFMLIPIVAFARRTVKIAAIMPMTGSAEATTASLVNTARLAVKEINQTGGLLGADLELIEFDNHSTPLGSKLAAEEAVKEGVIAVIGAIRSSNSIAMAMVLQNAEIPMISPASTNPAVTLAGDYIFRVCFVDSFQGEVVASFVFNTLKAKKVVVLTNTENRYCKGLADSFIRKFMELGGKVLWEGDYLEKISDFGSLVTTAGKFNPKVIFVPGYVKDSALIIRKAREKGLSAIFIGGDAWSNIMYDCGGTSVTGSYYSASWHPDAGSIESRKFVKKYRKEFGKIKNYNVGLVYDSVMILKEAVQRGKSFNPKTVRNSLASMKGFKGVTGEISFDKNGDPINKSAVILRLQNNTSVYVQTVFSGLSWKP